MTVTRAPLPGAATIVVVGDQMIILDANLTRDEATLAITGVLPQTPLAVVDQMVAAAFDATLVLAS